jgi:hypothetical protein
LSFFDEADEPSVAPRTAPRRRRPTGSGRRPPTDQQAILIRRAIAAGAILIVLILIVIGVHSCQVNAKISSLKNYGNHVATLAQESVATGSNLFKQLQSNTAASGGAQALQQQIDETRLSADNQLKSAQNLDVPSEMNKAHQYLVFAFQKRRDGIANIADNIQPALGNTANRDAINRIATEMARFYASDVDYKDYAVPLMIGVLKANNIAVGGSNGVPIESSQFLPDLGWLDPNTVAQRLGSSVSTPSGKPTPGTHGHSLDSVAVGGTTLTDGGSATLPTSPPPTFTFNFTNSGQNTEHNVKLKVSVGGTNISATTVVPQTSAGQSATGNVKLPSSPPAGTYNVTATVEPVPGEKTTSNNSQTYSITFQ